MKLGGRLVVALGAAALLASASATQSAVRDGASGPPAKAQPLAPQPVAGSTSAVATAGAHPLDAADLSAWLDGMVPYALKSGDIAGAVVVVVKDGQVLAQKGYGYADVATKRPMDPAQTMVRPGSTSKLFTWTAVMQLVQQGKIDLDRNVNDYLDFKIPEKFGPITMRDLMNHKTGFEEGLKDILTNDPKQLQSLGQYLKAHPRPELFPPGEVPAYSNYGAALAGYIVQRVSGEPFERYVERHVFLPLGMTHTTFDQPLPEQFQAQMAKGYRTASGPPSPFELVAGGPEGSASATAADMAKFMLAHLQQGRFNGYEMLNPATEALMQSPSETGLPGFDVMAHGFFHATQNGRLVIGHGGDTVVFHSELDMLPKEGVGIFYNFNSRGTGDAVYGARQALFDGFMNRYFPAPPAAAAQPTLASAPQDALEIAGRYESSRRVEHGFLSVLYLLEQSAITANPDGTITAPGGPVSGPAKYREIGPQLWRKVDGTGELALTRVRGVKTVSESDDPTSVLQAVSFLKSAPLNLNVLLFSLAVLVWTLVLWPLSALLRRGEPAPSDALSQVRRARLWQRGAAAVDLVYLTAWLVLIQPLLSTQLQAYTSQIDLLVGTLEASGLLAIAAAVVGLWSAWRMFRAGAPWLSRIWSVLVAAALLGVVWIGVMGQLMSWNLNY